MKGRSTRAVNTTNTEWQWCTLDRPFGLKSLATRLLIKPIILKMQSANTTLPQQEIFTNFSRRISLLISCTPRLEEIRWCSTIRVDLWNKNLRSLKKCQAMSRKTSQVKGSTCQMMGMTRKLWPLCPRKKPPANRTTRQRLMKPIFTPTISSISWVWTQIW